MKTKGTRVWAAVYRDTPVAVAMTLDELHAVAARGGWRTAKTGALVNYAEPVRATLILDPVKPKKRTNKIARGLREAIKIAEKRHDPEDFPRNRRPA